MSNASAPLQNVVVGGDAGGDVLNTACRQMALALRQQVVAELSEVVEERVREGIRSAINAANDAAERAEQRMKSDICGMEHRLQEHMRWLEERMMRNQMRLHKDLERRMRSVEEKIEEMGGRLCSPPVQEIEGASMNMEARMEALEASLQKSVMAPKVEALVMQLAARTPPLPPPATTSTAKGTLPSSAESPSPSIHRCLGEELLEVAKNGRLKDVQSVLDRGANIEFCDDRKMTALHLAAAHGRARTINFLLRSVAHVNSIDSRGSTPLHFASDKDTSGLSASLLLESRDIFGKTPLHYATEHGNEATVSVLLVAGANKEAKDNDGMTPLQYAKTEAIRRLLSEL